MYAKLPLPVAAKFSSVLLLFDSCVCGDAFVVSLLKKAAAKTGNKVDDLLVAQLEKALFES